MSVHLLMFSISGGADQGKFDINATTGVVNFRNAPDFENPTDQDANNLYEVTVRASDGSLYDDQVISVSVTDVLENTSPSNLAAGSLTITENQPIGTVVGESSMPPIRMPGRLTYHFGERNRDGNNSLFTLDADGTLRLPWFLIMKPTPRPTRFEGSQG